MEQVKVDELEIKEVPVEELEEKLAKQGKEPRCLHQWFWARPYTIKQCNKCGYVQRV